jgi:predicted amidohydrolase YtcJ
MLRTITLLAFSSFTISICYAQKKKTDADLILYNGVVWTGSSGNEFAESVAIKGNTILQTGKSASILQMAGVNTKKIDLQGQLVIPGFNDAHIHFLTGSLGLAEADLSNCKSVEQAVAIIDSFAKANPTAKWITGMGWQYTIFPGGLPTKEMLDKIIPDRPVYIRAYDGHSGWVNSKALELADITKETTFGGFGEIIKNVNGEPSGALTEAAQSLVSRLIASATKEEKITAIKKGLQYAASLGITSAQNASGSITEYKLYEELLKSKELTLRYAAAFSAGRNTTIDDIIEWTTISKKRKGNNMLRAGSVKFMLDGVIESHTAVMIESYSDESKNKNGDFALPLDIYQKLVKSVDSAGLQIYTHAIGDRSVHEALNAYEKAQVINKKVNTRHRIEHIEQCKPEDVVRFAKLGVMASMEPIHADPGTVAVWAKAVGEQRLPNSFVWSSMLKNNVKLVFSSDWPACISLDPIRGLHNAVNRSTIDGEPPAGWVPEQRISIRDALIAYTQAGAYSSFEEKLKGKIMPGYLADMVVLSQNLFRVRPADIYKAKVNLTIFDGRIIYQR